MAQYETEEQQVEALRKWWKDNGRSIIAGVVVGVGLLVGWKAWQGYQQQQSELASELFTELTRVVNLQQVDQVIAQAATLRDDYSNTPYAAMAALILAKAYNEKGELADTANNLDWVIANSKEPSLQELARLRKVRVLLAQNQLDQAEQQLSEDFTDTFDSLRFELQGDLYAQRGDVKAARDAYAKAIERSEDQSGLEFLMLKRDNLGVTVNKG